MTSGATLAGDLPRRAATAAVLAIIALGAVWFGGAPFSVLVLVALALLLWEWIGMTLPLTPKGDKIMATAAMTVLMIVALLAFLPGVLVPGVTAEPPNWLLGGAVAIAWLASIRLRRHHVLDPEIGPVHAGLGDLVNYYTWATWFAPAIFAALWLRHVHGPLPVFWLLAVIWASDIGAYLVGRVVGGPKLAPSISPGKTWSGAVGGLLAAIGVGVGMAAWLGNGLALDVALDGALLEVVWVAALVAVVGMIGDLSQSSFKRRAGVKDSGGLLPGHGGVFDRLDSLLVALPLFAVLVWAEKSPV